MYLLNYGVLNMKTAVFILFLVFAFNGFADDLPEGWIKVGSNPAGYDAGVVMDEGDNPPVAFIKSNDKTDESGFGTVMQQFFPKEYLGKRVEMTVLMKSEDVDGWAGAWLRIDGNFSKTIAFDNMENRPLKGDRDWKEYSIVLDVSEEAESINYGVLLAGDGQVWFDDFKFKEVSNSVDVTNVFRNKPLNNSF